MSFQTQPADPLTLLPRATRPAYTTGMLLDAQDFNDEQTYHRGRLARALAHLAGGGTLAGLELQHLAASSSQVECIQVNPGLALDRLGRLVEIPRPACIRLPHWYAACLAENSGDALRQSAYDNLARFTSKRMKDSGRALPARAVVADVFARFATCPVGLTPSFASGPYDALNAVSTSRICDAYELHLVLRTGLDDSYSGLPLPVAAAAAGDASATPAARRDALQDAVLHGYGNNLATLPEHPPGLDPSAVFLGRVFLPVSAANPPTRLAAATGTPIIDNWGRRFLPPLGLLSQWLGM